MDNAILIYGIPIINLAAISAYVGLRLGFKNSVVVKVGAIFLVVLDSVACFALFTGHLGVRHLLWAVPASAIMLFIGYYLISRELKNPLKILTKEINRLSKGDLSVSFSDNFLKRKDEMGDVSSSLNEFILILQRIMRDVQLTVEQLSFASREMNQASIQLSQGANTQAASAEEVSSSIEQMVANIEQNSQNARETEKIAMDSAVGAKQGSETANDAVEKMKRISNEIGIVDEIAQQTNILAINAAVEAARAGQHGKGFAVVAAEVRKLAENSKVAATKILDMSQSGSRNVIETGDQLERLLPEIQKTSDLVKSISQASHEQNLGANQINTAIQQLNQITQEAAHNSETLAKNSENLEALSNKLGKAVQFFKLG